MFTFIAGLQPKTRIFKDAPRSCPACGKMTFQKLRVDHMLSLFFIPLFPVSRGEPFFACPDCGVPAERSGDEKGGAESRPAQNCRLCARRLEPDFVYCPRCGQRV